MNKNIKLDDYEYNRLIFLIDVIQGKNFNIINDNKLFLESLDEKYKVLYNHSNEKFAKSFLDNSNLTSFYRKQEFFQIYQNFYNKFKNLYGLFDFAQIEGINLHKKFVEDLYYVYIPLSRNLYKNYYTDTNNSLICGIQAHPGCGKTTMTKILKFILNNVYDLKAEILSIDDLYKTYEELENLKKIDNRFKYRGPPGTHDLNLAKEILENVKNKEINYSLPRYNKSANNGLGDRAEYGVKINRPVDIFLFEGWFLGADPVDEKELENYQNNKENLQFQKHINHLLKEYQFLWNYTNYWIVIKPSKYKYSRKWRAHAEKNNKQGMTYKQLQDFLNYFLLTVPPNIYLKKIENKRNPMLTLTLDKHRNFLI